MRAAVVHEWGGPEAFSIENVPDPVPQPGEVVVALRAGSLNWHDAIIRRGDRDLPRPCILGMDGAGVRTDTGDEVVIYPCLGWSPGASFPGSGLTVIGDETDGTYAEYISVPEQNLYAKPPQLSWHEAASLPCAALTAYRAMFTRTGLRPGETALILGAGSGVSTFAIKFGAATGARVLVTSSTPDKIEAARTAGATAGFLYPDPDWPQQVQEFTSGGVDVILSGAGSNLPEALQCLRTGGRISVFGSTGGRTALVDIPTLYLSHASVFGVTLGSPDDFRSMLNMVADYGIRPTLDSSFALADIAEAHQLLETNAHTGKITFGC
ncbi:zinc-binding alcohol dehydrogenase family protein [Mycobacterium sp. SMC-18]|uniref:quinone oxidoreductase family protein n=1 Tax=Mycobacterium sp. SMC-18 TaxID=3381629 RepID=UPI0038773E91